jgi:hypothetical protein
MGEDVDPLTTNSLRATNRGIFRMMLVALAVATAVGFEFVGQRFGFGVMLGGAFAFINYFWLDRSTKAMMAESAMASTSILALKYVLRYVAIGGLLLLIFWSDVLPVTAVIVGLSIFAIAVVAQGLKSIFTGSQT